MMIVILVGISAKMFNESAFIDTIINIFRREFFMASLKIHFHSPENAILNLTIKPAYIQHFLYWLSIFLKTCLSLIIQFVTSVFSIADTVMFFV